MLEDFILLDRMWLMLVCTRVSAGYYMGQGRTLLWYMRVKKYIPWQPCTLPLQIPFSFNFLYTNFTFHSPPSPLSTGVFENLIPTSWPYQATHASRNSSPLPSNQPTFWNPRKNFANYFSQSTPDSMKGTECKKEKANREARLLVTTMLPTRSLRH